jgi:hypothetical protein
VVDLQAEEAAPRAAGRPRAALKRPIPAEPRGRSACVDDARAAVRARQRADLAPILRGASVPFLPPLVAVTARINRLRSSSRRRGGAASARPLGTDGRDTSAPVVRVGEEVYFMAFRTVAVALTLTFAPALASAQLAGGSRLVRDDAAKEKSKVISQVSTPAPRQQGLGQAGLSATRLAVNRQVASYPARIVQVGAGFVIVDRQATREELRALTTRFPAYTPGILRAAGDAAWAAPDRIYEALALADVTQLDEGELRAMVGNRRIVEVFLPAAEAPVLVSVRR